MEQPNRLIYRNFFWNDPATDCGVPIIFEPDYWGEKRKTIDYINFCDYIMTEIAMNTLPDNKYEELIDDSDTVSESFFFVESGTEETWIIWKRWV